MEYFDSRTRNDIERLIREHGGINYDGLISDRGYYHFYHLSSLRHALLDWYPFEKGKALEIDPGYGGLTGLLLDRIGEVDVAETDPRICSSLRARFGGRLGIQEMEPFGAGSDERYDYVFVIDAPSMYSADVGKVIAAAKRLLKDEGTAVIGFRNMYGIKYDCGALDEYVNEPFHTERLISKQEFDEKAREWFRYVRYYYPFPDHIYTQAVFSDDCLPRENLRDRVLPMDPFDSPLIEKEISEYGKAVRDGSIAQRSNFCLVFLSDIKRDESAAVQAILSYDRGERSQMTVFFDNGTVKKTAVNEKGKESLKRSFLNLEDIRSRGVLTVEQRYENGVISMPWIKAESLQERLQRLAASGDTEGLTDVFHAVKKAVEMSSETDDSGYDPEKWGLPAEIAGPILRRGYIDLIPLNAFDTDAGIMFYDQEFCEEYCPSVYPLYRAILYSYMSIPGIADVIPKREMFGRFGIDQRIEKALNEAEDRFIEKTRNIGLYKQMYGWAYGITDKRIDANRRRLKSKE